MARNNKIMVAGHICLDITPSFKNYSGNINDILCPGKLVNVEDAVLSTGGAVSNTGMAMGKIGIDVMLNGKIGDDHFGTIIKNLVGKDRSKSFKVVSGQSSSYSVVLAIPGIDRIFLHNPGTNDTFTSNDIDYDAAMECCLFHFGYPPLMKQMYLNQGSELVKIFEKVQKNGTITSLDMTLPDPDSESGKVDWPAIIKNTLPFVDIFMPSIEEIAYMLDRNMFTEKKNSGKHDPVLAYDACDCELLADKLLAMGVKIVAIKCGINGLFLKTAPKEKLTALSNKMNIELWADQKMWMPSFFAEKFASATGAGDATIGGFLAAVVNECGPRESLAIANAMGLQNVAQFDTLSGIGTWEDTVRIANDSSLKQNLHENVTENWHYDSGNRVYIPA
ncbi:MAG: carbohydrate kinase family protein [Sedimentisphaeraceae bacterium JB056]